MLSVTHTFKPFLLASLAICLFNAPVAHAADQNAEVVDILPPQTQDSSVDHTAEINSTHPPIKLTPDQSQLIRLDTNAKSIIVGNPAHVNVLADSAKTLVVVPRAPGATHFIVLGEDDNVVMQRHVIVASPKKNYVRIKRTCREDSDGCNTTSVFYCPDMCHEIGMNGQESDGGGGDTPAEGDGGSGQGGGQYGGDTPAQTEDGLN